MWKERLQSTKISVLAWLLLGSMILSACGGASAPAESSASTPPAQSLTQEPAQSAMAPVVTAPDVSAPDTSAPDVSVPDASSPDAGQSGGDLRGFVKELNQTLSGRGGGKPDFVQGSVQAKRWEIEAFFGAL